MRQGKSFGNRLDFWTVRPWGEHQTEHSWAFHISDESPFSIKVFADMQAFEDAMKEVELTISTRLSTPMPVEAHNWVPLDTP